VNAAVKLANSGNLNEANILLFEAVKKNPNDFDAIYILAQVSNLLGKKDMEIIYREKSFILNPYLDENIYKLALIYKELNQITNLNNLISRVSARPGSSEISLKLATLV
jgi:tetratricopeptide (TPR) repeat protein